MTTQTPRPYVDPDDDFVVGGDAPLLADAVELEYEIAPHIWEQQVGESQKAYAAFAAYRDLGPHVRSVQKTADAIGKGWTTCREWSDKWRWPARAAAYDANNDRIKLAATRKAIEDMAARQATQGQALAQALMIPTEALLRRLQENPDEIRRLDKMSVEKLVTFVVQSASAWSQAMRGERLARGEKTDEQRSEHSGTVEHVFRNDNADGDQTAYLRSLTSHLPDGPGGSTPAED